MSETVALKRVDETPVRPESIAEIEMEMIKQPIQPATVIEMPIQRQPFIQIQPQMPSSQFVVVQSSGVGRYIYSVFHLIMSLVAIYLSFKCNNGFNVSSFIIAFCCPYIYIIYVLATRGTCGVFENTAITK